jgi:Fic family protein
MTKQLQPVGYETKDWESSLMGEMLSRREREWIANHKTYEASIPEYIADIDVDIPNELHSKLDEALVIIGRFDSMIAMKEYSLPLIMLRSESASSSQIEHLTASAKNIALAELSKDAPSNSKLIANNINAMKKAMDEASHFSLSTIKEVHQALLKDMNIDFAGKIREEQVWIGGSNLGPSDADFVPPYHTRVPDLLNDLIKFSKRSDINSIVKAAVLHAQFETIHPFADGNGRTGRTLLHIILKQDEVLLNSALPISAGLLHNVDNYFNALNKFHNGDPLPIVEEMCDAIFMGAQIGSLMIVKIEELLGKWKESIRARTDAKIWKLLEVLIEQPVVNPEFIAEKLGITLRTAYNVLDTAENEGVVKKIGNRYRGLYFECKELTRILDVVGSTDALRRFVSK